VLVDIRKPTKQKQQKKEKEKQEIKIGEDIRLES
jgi:hypothetical protein